MFRPISRCQLAYPIRARIDIEAGSATSNITCIGVRMVRFPYVDLVCREQGPRPTRYHLRLPASPAQSLL